MYGFCATTVFFVLNPVNAETNQSRAKLSILVAFTQTSLFSTTFFVCPSVGRLHLYLLFGEFTQVDLKKQT